MMNMAIFVPKTPNLLKVGTTLCRTRGFALVGRVLKREAHQQQPWE